MFRPSLDDHQGLDKCNNNVLIILSSTAHLAKINIMSQTGDYEMFKGLVYANVHSLLMEYGGPKHV
jgi:phosphatidylserine synthase